MLQLPARSPIDGGEIVVTRFVSPQSGGTVEGEFSVSIPFATLSADHLQFIETFVRCEGKMNRMESEMNLSYPTLRTRLYEVIRALGYEPAMNPCRRLRPQPRKTSVAAFSIYWMRAS